MDDACQTARICSHILKKPAALSGARYNAGYNCNAALSLI